MTARFLRSLTGVVIFSLTLAVAQAPQDSWWKRLLRVTGISANPGKQRGGSLEVKAGHIWIHDVKEKTGRRLTNTSDFRSPIFVNEDKDILALQNDQLVTIPVAGGPLKKLFEVKGAVKIVGLSLDEPKTAVLLTADKDTKITIALLSLETGKLTPVSYETETTEGESMFAHLAGWNRIYADTEISVDENSKKDQSGRTRKWTDVFLKRPNQDLINVSNCNGVNCGQPSLSQDGSLVAFVKAER